MNTPKRPFNPKIGDFVQLYEDVMPIPKGIYRLCSIDEFGAMFAPGKKVRFGIWGNWKASIKPVLQSRAWKLKTKQADFVERYYELLGTLKQHEPSGDIFTCCFLDPSLGRELNMENKSDFLN